MDTHHLLMMGLVLMLGAFVQSASGFGYGLFAIPLLLLLGFKPYVIVPMVAVAVATQTMTGIWQHREDVQWKQILLLILMAVATQPLGVYILSHLVTLDRGTLRQIFGFILLLALFAHTILRPEPRDRLHPAWAVLAMTLAGLFSGMAGMGGPPIVLWTMAHRWSSERIRVTLWTVFLGIMPTNLFLYYQQFGDEVLKAAGTGLMFIPVVLLGALPGLWVGNRLPRETLRKVALFILLLLGLYAVLQPMLLPQLSG